MKLRRCNRLIPLPIALLTAVLLGCTGARPNLSLDTKVSSLSVGEAPQTNTDVISAEPSATGLVRPKRVDGPPVALWERPVPFATGLAANPDRVFVIAGNDMLGLDAASGSAVWTYEAAELGSSARRLGCACAAGGVLRGDGLYTVAGGDTVLALDPAKGNIRWSQRVGQAVATPPTERDGNVVVVTRDDDSFFLASLDAATGRLRWQTRPVAPIFPALVPFEDAVLAPLSRGGAAAFDLSTGELRWSTEDRAAQDLFAPSQMGSGVLVLKADQGISALDARTGRALWRKAMPDWPIVLSVSGEHAYAGTFAGQLFAFDLRTGDIGWTLDLTPGFFSDALLTTERGLYVLTRGGRMVALDPATGEVQWENRFAGAFGAPSLVDGALAIGTFDGTVHVLEPATGVIRGTASVPGPVMLPPAERPGGFLVLAEGREGATLVAFGWGEEGSG